MRAHSEKKLSLEFGAPGCADAAVVVVVAAVDAVDVPPCAAGEVVSSAAHAATAEAGAWRGKGQSGPCGSRDSSEGKVWCSVVRASVCSHVPAEEETKRRSKK